MATRPTRRMAQAKRVVAARSADVRNDEWMATVARLERSPCGYIFFFSGRLYREFTQAA